MRTESSDKPQGRGRSGSGILAGLCSHEVLCPAKSLGRDPSHTWAHKIWENGTIVSAAMVAKGTGRT